MRNFRVLATISIVTTYSSPAMAFPLLISVANHPDLESYSRQSMAAFAWEKGALVRLPLQVDEIEEDTFVVMRNPSEEMPGRRSMHHPPPRDPFEGRLQQYHRLAVDGGRARPCDAECQREVRSQLQDSCAPARWWEARVPSGDSVFVASCRKGTPPASSVVNFQTSTRTLTTNTFELVYGKTSPLLLESLKVGEGVQMLGSSAMEVRLNPKFFFKLSFDEKNIQPQITAVQYGPVSAIAELALSLRTMGLSTSFEICCDMTAYRDAFYLPIMIDVPFASLKNVSGVFYGFQFPGHLEREVETNLPKFSELESRQERPTSAHIALTRAGKTLAIGIRSRGGLPPTFVTSQQDLRRLEFKEGNANLGFFVDLSRVPKGRQRIEIWYAVGDATQKARLIDLASQGLKYEWVPRS